MKIKWQRSVVWLVFIWTLASGLYLARHDSLTTDEDIHIASGYLVLTRHQFWFDPEHPYLFKVLTALPVLAIHPSLPPKDQQLWTGKTQSTFYDSWQEAREWADEWFYTTPGNNANQMTFLARLPAVAVLLGLCWLVYRLATEWFGEKVGLWALVFTTFNPTLLANGHLATTDVPVAFGYVLTMFAMWRYWQRPSWRTATWISLAFTITMLTKFSAVALVPILIIWFGYMIYKKGEAKQRIFHLIGIFLLFYLLLWSAYLFHYHTVGTPPNTPNFDGVNHLLQKLHITWQGMSYVIPPDYLKGLLLTQYSTLYGRGTYLLGHHFYPNIWYYFPVVYGIKTQLIAFVLFIAGIYLAWRLKKHSENTAKYLLLGLMTAVFGAFAMASKLNLGIRHIAILMPFFSIYLALSAVAIQQFFRGRVWVPVTVSALYILPVVVQIPNIFGFTNVLVHPYSEGYRYIDDSNIDWGQQSEQLVSIAKTRYSGQQIYGSNMWNPYSLGYYGLHILPYNIQNPPHSGVLVLTATQMAKDEYRNFWNITPDYILANNTYFYKLQ